MEEEYNEQVLKLEEAITSNIKLSDKFNHLFNVFEDCAIDCLEACYPELININDWTESPKYEHLLTNFKDILLDRIRRNLVEIAGPKRFSQSNSIRS